jgi:hypothetical protein
MLSVILTTDFASFFNDNITIAYDAVIANWQMNHHRSPRAKDTQ